MKYILNLFLILVISANILFSDDDIKSKELYLSYKSYPNRVFTGQKFNIKLEAIILTNELDYDNIVTTFTNEDNIGILTQNVKWIKSKNAKYSTTIAYKAYDKKFNLPTITVALVKDDNIIDFISIKPPKIKYEKIAINQKTFSNIIASSFEIDTVKTKQYTNNTLHTTLYMEALNSNLEDTKIDNYPEQGITDLTQDGDIQKIHYYIMIPSHTKQIDFTYYNTKLKDFVMMHIPIIMDEELVSTQTELNPYNSSILIYKQSISVILLLFFILLYIFTKKERWLILVTILILILVYLFIPNKKVLLKKDVKVYILPTKNSTVYEVLNSKKLVEIINRKDGFIKVLFQNENIGWIKENDIK